VAQNGANKFKGQEQQATVFAESTTKALNQKWYGRLKFACNTCSEIKNKINFLCMFLSEGHLKFGVIFHSGKYG
jgi:hypothetical protein